MDSLTPVIENAFSNQTQSSTQSLDDLVEAHFQPIFALVDAYLENPNLSLKITETFFKVMRRHQLVSPVALYKMVVESVGFENCSCALLDTIPYPQATCWLLKELTGFRYQEIGWIMGMPVQQVKEHIAEARYLILEQVAS